MGLLQNANAIPSAAAAADFYSYQINQSCRFDGSSSVLTKTWGASATDDDKFAISVWVKGHHTDGTWGVIASSAQSELMSLYVQARSDSDAHAIGYYTGNGGNNAASLALGRDVSAWRHIVMIYDSSQGAGADRLKIYNNGEHWTTGSTTYWGDIDNNGYPDQNTDGGWGLNGNANEIGRYQYNGTGDYYGYMADFVSIDGAASISDFGETKNGVWIAKDPSGLTFGNNGFWLDFASSGDLGNDVSGNNNDWSAAGLSTHDQIKDSPTFNSDSNGGNFSTLNPLSTLGPTFSEGNLRADADTYWLTYYATMNIPKTGKWYAECCTPSISGPDASFPMGIQAADKTEYLGSKTGSGNPQYIGMQTATAGEGYSIYTHANGTYTKKYSNNIDADTTLASAVNDDVYQIAIDMDNNKLWFGKNGTWDGANPATGGSETYAITAGKEWIMGGSASDTEYHIWNFGNDSSFAGVLTSGSDNASDATGYGDFYETPPTDFLALCSGNLPTPAADPASDEGPNKYFQNILYTGNSGNDITVNTNFAADWIWAKSRSHGDNWYAMDSTRGYGGSKNLSSNTNGAEGYNGGDAANMDITTTDTTIQIEGGDWCTNTYTYVAELWKVNGGATSTNDEGSEDSTVQVDADRGISILTYTGTGSAATIGHGLGVAPSFIIVKDRTSGSSNNWAVYHAGLATDPETDYLLLDDTAAAADDSTYWNDTAPTTDVFSIGTNADVNTNTNTYVAYAFANKEGFSKFGVYEGNGNADGSFVYTGFKPSLLALKRIDGLGSWLVSDSARRPFNDGTYRELYWNSASEEQTGADSHDGVDYLSNGFKLKATNAGANGAGNYYVYIAFAKNPFKYATAF